MVRRLAGLALGIGCVAAAASSTAQSPTPSPAQTDVPECVEVTAEARYQGYGYTHVVKIENRCTDAIQCEVSTDVDPEPRHRIRVPARQSAEVVTRRGSPSREVQPRGTCSRQ